MNETQSLSDNNEAAFDAWLAGRTPEADGDFLLPQGTTLAEYRVCDFLGRGGCGEVYSARHERLGSMAAIKILFKDTPQMRVRFEREAKILAEKRYREFPLFISYGEHEGRPYIIEELLSSRPLPSKDADVAEFLIKVATAVGRLHGMGLIHRDIKPDNILWRQGGEPVLIDMGLACADKEGRKCATPLSMADGKPMAVGTPGYAAPEQLLGGEVDAAADIHALGVLANACFSSKPSHAWCRIIRRASSSIAAQRYRSTGEFIRAVKNRHRVRNWAMIVSPIAALCAIVGVGLSSAENAWWEYSMKLSGRLYPPDRSFSILPIDDTELMPLDELGIAGWGMGGTDDCPVVFVQRLAYDGDFAIHKELQSKLGATYGGRTTVCDEEVTNSVLRVEIDDWREGDRLLYTYRKLFVAGNVIYQVSGQTQMRTKDRDRAKLKSAVDSFRLR